MLKSCYPETLGIVYVGRQLILCGDLGRAACHCEQQQQIAIQESASEQCIWDEVS